MWFLREWVNFWEVVGEIAAFIGVILTIVLQPPENAMMNVGGFRLGIGELLKAFFTGV